MTSLLRHMQLRPHGDNLLTPATAFWLFSARVLVLAMATSEAVAWGYLGFLFGEDTARWVGAAFTGITIFLVVWMVDASLITMDRASREHAAEILGEHNTDWFRPVRLAFTLFLRIGLLGFSLWITAPYLAQVVFYKDIQRFNDAEATTNLDIERQRLNETLTTAIARADVAVAAKQQTLAQEISGTGDSKQRGSGPVAAARQKELDAAIAERQRLLADKTETLGRFDKLAEDWRANRELFASTYNVTLPRASILQNSKALEELRKRPENQRTEIAIKAFLTFIFLGLLLLKLFEPRSVRLYMSDVLQQEYLRYQAGAFNDVLPPSEKSTSGMSPQRLYQFLVTEWIPNLHLQQEKQHARERAEARQRRLSELEAIRNQIDGELRQAGADHHAAVAHAERMHRALDDLKSAIKIVDGDIETITRQLERWQAEEREGDFDDESVAQRERLKTKRRQKLAEANRALDRLREDQPGDEDRVTRADAALEQCERRLREKQAELDAISRRIRDLQISATAVDLADTESVASN